MKAPNGDNHFSVSVYCVDTFEFDTEMIRMYVSIKSKKKIANNNFKCFKCRWGHVPRSFEVRQIIRDRPNTDLAGFVCLINNDQPTGPFQGALLSVESV